MKIFPLVILSCIFMYTGCFIFNKTKSPSIQVTGSWVNKEKISDTPYNSVFIAALTQNLETRTLLEGELAKAAEANGIKAVKSLEVFGPVTASADSNVIKALVRKIHESGCAAIMTVSLVDSKSETKYTPSSSYTYQPYASYGYYGTFAGYYSYAASSYYSPGYYSTDKTYYIETNLYDVNTQGILFSIQTIAENPGAINEASQRFTETLIDELKSNGLLKKEEVMLFEDDESLKYFS